jgi:predicted DNA binding CopG/RHH family protein
MKKPKLSEVVLDQQKTNKIRSRAKDGSGVKITINIDGAVLKRVKAIADKSGVPYQRLINRLLSDSLDRKSNESERLEKIEAEIREIKKKLVA